MPRRFYFFSSPKSVAEHVSQIKTLTDLQQIASDIAISGTNLTRFIEESPGVYSINYADIRSVKRYIFMTKKAYATHGAPDRSECESFTVL